MIDTRLVQPDSRAEVWIVTFKDGRIEKSTSSNKHNAKVYAFWQHAGVSEPINAVPHQVFGRGTELSPSPLKKR